jgi:hypothetical protein
VLWAPSVATSIFSRTVLGRSCSCKIWFQSSHYLGQPTRFFLYFCTTSVPSQLLASSSPSSTRYHIRVTALLWLQHNDSRFYPSCLQSPHFSDISKGMLSYPPRRASSGAKLLGDEQLAHLVLQRNSLERSVQGNSNNASSSTTRSMELTDTTPNRDAYQLKLIQEPVEGRAAGRTEKGE